MDVIKAIETRRSVRKYKQNPIPQADLKKILESGRLAPSAGNKQPWGFVVVQNKERRWHSRKPPLNSFGPVRQVLYWWYSATHRKAPAAIVSGLRETQ